jgi:hypothetical protein
MRMKKTLGTVLSGALALSAVLVAGERDAHATGPVSATAKGTVGGALLGIEVVDLTIGAIGVDKGWPYLVFGGLGGIGGGIAGHFVEKSSSAEPSLYMLAGGMALVIPTLVVSLNALSYKPPEGDSKDPVNTQPAAQPPAPGQVGGTIQARHVVKSKASTARVMPHIPLSVVDVYQGRVAMGLPAFEVKPLYTQQEVATYGVQQGTQIHFPVIQAVF